MSYTEPLPFTIEYVPAKDLKYNNSILIGQSVQPVDIVSVFPGDDDMQVETEQGIMVIPFDNYVPRVVWVTRS